MRIFEDDDPLFAPMTNALFAAFRGTAVMSGCEASATGTSRTVSITAGSVQINGEVIAVGAGSVTLDAGSTFDRYDLVSVNASGSKIVTKGTTKRKCPTQPANTCLLAIVFVPAGATVIATGDVYDARMLTSQLVAQSILASGAITCPVGRIGGVILENGVSGVWQKATAGDTVRKTASGSVTPIGVANTWVEVVRVTLDPATHYGDDNSYRVNWGMSFAYSTIGAPHYGKLCVNGVQVGEELVAIPESSTTGRFPAPQVDLTNLSPGDTISVWAKCPSATTNVAVTGFTFGAEFSRRELVYTPLLL